MAAPTFSEATRAFARIAAQSFGGPAGQIAVMHRVVVEEEQWLGDAEFAHAASFCMLLPGPEAQQLATWLGWRFHGVRGGLVGGGLFVLPGFLSILALSFAYVLGADVPWVAGALYGLRVAVVAVVFEAVVRLSRKMLRDRIGVAVAVASFTSLFLFDAPFPLVVLAAAGFGAARGGARATLSRSRPDARAAARTAATWLAVWWLPVLALLAIFGPDSLFVQLATYFSGTAVLTFGGAYAMLGWVAQEAVEARQWLTPADMLAGLGLAETTPGPLVQVVQFVGFVAAWRAPEGYPPWVAATVASVITTWVTFVPSFLWVFTGAPYVDWLRDQPRFTGAIGAVGAAVVGVVAHLGVWLAVRTVFGAVVEVDLGYVRVGAPDVATFDAVATAGAVAAGVALIVAHVPLPRVLCVAAVAGAAIGVAA
jgi:chromate transporter